MPVSSAEDGHQSQSRYPKPKGPTLIQFYIGISIMHIQFVINSKYEYQIGDNTDEELALYSMWLYS